MNEAVTTLTPAPQEIKLTPAQEARFWAKVNKSGPTMPGMDSACWVWNGAKDSSGYGLLWGAKYLKAHRVSWTLANGQIPHDGSLHGLFVCHHCDQRYCTNPAHLFLGTNTDNMRDMAAKGRKVVAFGDRNGARTKPESRQRGDMHHSRRHPERLARGIRSGAYTHPEKWARGEAHHKAKLTAAIVINIRARYAAGGVTKKSLAIEFNVSQSLVGDIIHRKIWKHIPAVTTDQQNDTKAIGCE